MDEDAEELKAGDEESEEEEREGAMENVKDGSLASLSFKQDEQNPGCCL